MESSKGNNNEDEIMKEIYLKELESGESDQEGEVISTIEENAQRKIDKYDNGIQRSQGATSSSMQSMLGLDPSNVSVVERAQSDFGNLVSTQEGMAEVHIETSLDGEATKPLNIAQLQYKYAK